MTDSASTMTISIDQAGRMTGIGKDRLRELMHNGTLKGYVSKAGKRFRPSVYSLLVNVLGYPSDVAGKVVVDALAEHAACNTASRTASSTRLALPRPPIRNQRGAVAVVRQVEPDGVHHGRDQIFVKSDPDVDAILIDMRRRRAARRERWRNEGRAKLVG
ncbi:MAG: hypothetical protein HY287_00665 [Planctomycetes bacterium]|nr:hypothetical protein [Planctomycetota bacterium]